MTRPRLWNRKSTPTAMEQRLVDHLAAHGPRHLYDLARELGSTTGSLSSTLSAMTRLGQVLRVDRGVYALPGQSYTPPAPAAPPTSAAPTPAPAQGPRRRPAPLPELKTTLSPMEARAIADLAASGPQHIAELARVLGSTPNNVSSLLSALVRQGHLIRLGRGRYAVPEAAPQRAPEPVEDWGASLPPRFIDLEDLMVPLTYVPEFVNGIAREATRKRPDLAEAIGRAARETIANLCPGYLDHSPESSS